MGSGLNQNNGTTDVELFIVNENDEAPMFTDLSYVAAIPENSDAGASVTVVSQECMCTYVRTYVWCVCACVCTSVCLWGLGC